MNTVSNQWICTLCALKLLLKGRHMCFSYVWSIQSGSLMCALTLSTNEYWIQYRENVVYNSLFTVCWPYDGLPFHFISLSISLSLKHNRHRRHHRHHHHRSLSLSAFIRMNDFFLVPSINYSFLLLLLHLEKVTFAQQFRIESNSMSILMNMNANKQKREHSNRLLLSKLLQLYCFVVQ